MRWGRILAGAVLLELALSIVFVPMLMINQALTIRIVPVGVLLFGFLVSWWILRKVKSRHVLHGALIGVIATSIYVGLGVFAPGGIGSIVELYGPFLFVFGNGLRIVGCIAGGYAARSRKG